MIRFRQEGELLINGLNIYHPKEWGTSRGFILKFGDYKYRFRYSVKLKKFLVGLEKRKKD
jgi:hypothetical protein